MVLSSRSESRLYQLKIQLVGSKPPISRTVIVRADMTLDRLHDVFQAAMGWDDSHLHQFILKGSAKLTFFGVTGFKGSGTGAGHEERKKLYRGKPCSGGEGPVSLRV